MIVMKLSVRTIGLLRVHESVCGQLLLTSAAARVCGWRWGEGDWGVLYDLCTSCSAGPTGCAAACLSVSQARRQTQTDRQTDIECDG